MRGPIDEDITVPEALVIVSVSYASVALVVFATAWLVGAV
jgi:hypothetical protein